VAFAYYIRYKLISLVRVLGDDVVVMGKRNQVGCLTTMVIFEEIKCLRHGNFGRVVSGL
jgi:hypothetical protein